MRRHRCIPLVTFLGALIFVAWATPASAQFQVETKDGKANIKIGFLVQPQLEALETPDQQATSKNMFLRRVRILFGGKVSDKWTYFFETDSPNVGKAVPDKTANPTGAKDTSTIFMQDMYVTYNYSDDFKVDAGLMLLGQSHNHLQSAASLMPVDYGPYTFLESGPLQERVGRDYGVEVRGYPLKQKLEYRLGVFQGLRGVEARNQFRWVGRGVWYPFGADTGFFYAGTYQGSRKLVAVGGSFDVQKGYSSYGFDVFGEQPMNGGKHGFTGQFDWLRFDGGSFITTFPKQDTYLLEVGYHFNKTYTPFVQYQMRNFAVSSTPDQNSLQVGIAYWMSQSHQRNLKFSAGRLHVGGTTNLSQTQVLLQLQIFYY